MDRLAGHEPGPRGEGRHPRGRLLLRRGPRWPAPLPPPRATLPSFSLCATLGRFPLRNGSLSFSCRFVLFRGLVPTRCRSLHQGALGRRHSLWDAWGILFNLSEYLRLVVLRRCALEFFSPKSVEVGCSLDSLEGSYSQEMTSSLSKTPSPSPRHRSPDLDEEKRSGWVRAPKCKICAQLIATLPAPGQEAGHFAHATWGSL